MAKCKQCKQDYGTARPTSQYCSPKCKQTAYRNRMKPDSVTPVTVTDAKPVTVTETDDMFSETISWDVIHNLPPGVSRPTVKPTDTEPNGPDWWNEPSYARVIDRLLNCDPYELEDKGVFVPSWAFHYHGLPLYRTAGVESK